MVLELSPAGWGGLGEQEEVSSRGAVAVLRRELKKGEVQLEGAWGSGGCSRGPRTGKGRRGKLAEGRTGTAALRALPLSKRLQEAVEVFQNSLSFKLCY